MRHPAPAGGGSAPASSGGRRRRVVSGTLATTIAANLPVFLVGGLAVQMKADLGFGPAALGIAAGAFFAMGALSSPFTGRLVERVGPALSLRAAALLSGAVQLAIAVAAESIVPVVVLLAIGGLANAWAQPASNVALADVVPARRLGVALGVQKSAIPAAALLGGLAVPVVALTVGWRWAFVGGALLSFVCALLMPDSSPRPRRRRAVRVEGKPDVPMRNLVLLAIGVGLGSSASNALGAFLVLSSVAAGVTEAAAGLMLTGGSIAGICMRLLAGSRADRNPGGTLRAMAAMFVLAGVSFAMLASGDDLLLFVATPLAFATAYAWPGLFHLFVVRTNPSAPGAATGIAMTGTLSGAVAGPMLFGAIAGASSYAVAWLCAAGMLLCGAAVLVVSSRRIPEPDHAVAPEQLATPA